MNKEESHNDTGAEVESGRMGKHLAWLTTAVILLAVSVVAGVYWNSTMKIQQVAFSGNNFVSADELEEIEVPIGISPDSMNFMKIINEFEEIPFVRRADIDVEPGGKLFVQVTERRPAALLAGGSRKMYIDRDGLLLPVDLGKVVDVPILYGFKSGPVGDTLTSEGFRTVAQFLTELQNRPVSNATVSEIAWTGSEGVVALTNQNGVKLIFGYGDFASRMRNWEAFYGEVVRQKGIENMRSIDLRFQGQIVAHER